MMLRARLCSGLRLRLACTVSVLFLLLCCGDLCLAADEIQASRVKLYSDFAAQVEKLAIACAEQGAADQAARLRRFLQPGPRLGVRRPIELVELRIPVSQFDSRDLGGQRLAVV